MFLLLFASSGLLGQEVEVSFPQLANREVVLYYFSGPEVDSVVSTIDANGAAGLTVPIADYCGMVLLKVGNNSGVEAVVCGKETKIACAVADLNIKTVDFSASEENTVLKRLLTEARQTPQHQELLQSAEQSTAYASRYYTLINFMNRLFEADMRADKTAAIALQQEMETSLDIAALYRTGQLWSSVHNYYISLFNRTNEPDKHIRYAKSIIRTLDRLSRPLYDVYLAGCLVEMERFGWDDSREMVIENVRGGVLVF